MPLAQALRAESIAWSWTSACVSSLWFVAFRTVIVHADHDIVNGGDDSVNGGDEEEEEMDAAESGGEEGERRSCR